VALEKSSSLDDERYRVRAVWECDDPSVKGNFAAGKLTVRDAYKKAQDHQKNRATGSRTYAKNLADTLNQVAQQMYGPNHGLQFK
jgi:hypothetical protein